MAKKNVSKSLERVVAETAMLAGETMLIAGAEISRVEDTMNRILDYSKCESHTAFVLATGITLTLDSEEGLITMSKRVPDRTTNINRIYLINNVSRALSAGKMDIYEAYSEIKKIKDVRHFIRSLLCGGGTVFYNDAWRRLYRLYGGRYSRTCYGCHTVGTYTFRIQFVFLKYDLHTQYGAYCGRL